MTEYQNGGYIPSKGRWANPGLTEVTNTTGEPEGILTANVCNCEPEEFEGEIIHWSSCPENEGGCAGEACSL